MEVKKRHFSFQPKNNWLAIRAKITMKNDLKKSLTTLINTPAVSGYEWFMGIPNTIQLLTTIKGYRIGDNLIFKVGKGKKKICISAHMDEVGFFISKIEKDFVRIMPIGGINIQNCIGKQLIFQTTDGYCKTEVIKKTSSFSQLKVYGLAKPQVGMVGTFEKSISVKDDFITSPSLDNKVGCLAVLEVMNSIAEDRDKTYIFCFACREEVSINGIMEAVKEINPDFCIDVDSAYALPISSPLKKKNWQIPKIGNGPAIQLIGNGFIIRSDNRFLVESVAQKNNIPYQYEIPDEENGGTNASTLIANGYDTIQINVPVANQHSGASRASFTDIVATKNLLLNVLNEI